MAVNLDPQKGIEVADALTTFCDKVILETANIGYSAIKSLGDGNAIVEDFKVTFNNFQNTYNDQLVPAFDSGKKAFEEFTDFADYVSKLQIDTAVTSADVGTVQAGAYDAARNL